MTNYMDYSDDRLVLGAALFSFLLVTVSSSWWLKKSCACACKRGMRCLHPNLGGVGLLEVVVTCCGAQRSTACMGGAGGEDWIGGQGLGWQAVWRAWYPEGVHTYGPICIVGAPY